MYELVDVHAIEHSGSPFLYTDKVDPEMSNNPPKIAQGKIWRMGIAMGAATGRDLAVAITKLLFRVRLPAFNREKLQSFSILS